MAMRRHSYRFISDSQIWSHFDAYKKDAEHELVVLLTILKHDVNLGYGLEHVGVLLTWDERPVKSLADFAKAVGKAKREGEEFLRFVVKKEEVDARGEAGQRPDIVLECALVEAADVSIRETNQMPDVASAAMLPFLKDAC